MKRSANSKSFKGSSTSQKAALQGGNRDLCFGKVELMKKGLMIVNEKYNGMASISGPGWMAKPILTYKKGDFKRNVVLKDSNNRLRIDWGWISKANSTGD